MKVQPCNKCSCPIKWDMSLEPPMKRDKKGWWREDLSKEPHTLERCKKFQNSKEFMEKQSVENAQNNPDVQEAPSPIKDVTDFAAGPMKQEVMVHCKYIKIIEDSVIEYLGKDTNPAKVGMYMKFIIDMLEKK